MGESLYGKFGFVMVLVGFIILAILSLVSTVLRWLMPKSIISLLFVLHFIFIIIGIVLKIISLKEDDLGEKAKRVIFWGVCFLIGGIALSILYYGYIVPRFG